MLSSMRFRVLYRLVINIRPSIRSLSQIAPIKTNPPSNVDQYEVDTLAKMASDWWDPTGPLKGLHSMNALRVPLIRDGLISTCLIPKEQIRTPQVLSGINILEVGCGGGILTEALARIRADVCGIDPGEKLIEVAKDHAQLLDQNIASKIHYEVETVEEHSKKNVEKYDAIVVSEVLEHVSNKIMFLEHCLMALKPGGSIFITTLNKTTASWLGGIVAAEYILDLVPKNTHDWDKFISPLDLQRVLKTYNCSTILVHGMCFEFWRNSWCWTESTEINYALQAVKLMDDS
ncbi:ubiquinone biosynthesis O-methyltransferase, mitochondrial-like [Topomyia yanbarensis]|uniref:ubiquinone biosynthesis O-methyltransferase, mitochondrial-like n=1 Tax=Topomyia yanbarensis TaxID=2498891 RepID=UPI00273C146C|nr:ubiquinone biosynthesis O-methyltransferase, mitochondrial-like [Topomyia yanbarensis]